MGAGITSFQDNQDRATTAGKFGIMAATAALVTGRSRFRGAVQLIDLRSASATNRITGGVDVRPQAEKTKNICVHRCDGNRVHHTCFLRPTIQFEGW